MGAVYGGLAGVGAGVFGEVGDFVGFGEFELVANFEIAAAERGNVDGEEDGFVTCFFSSSDQFAGVFALFEEVEL